MQSMRKVLIGMKGDLKMAFNTMTVMSMKLMETPTINGSNLFTGDYVGDTLMIGEAVSSQEQWEAYWKVLGVKPPGKLPDGALAIFQASDKSDRAIRLEPKTITQNGADISVEWERMNIPRSEMMGAHSSYAVLLIPLDPKGKLSASFMDTFPLAEMRQRKMDLETAIDAFKHGGPMDIAAPSKAMFMKKYKFT